MFDGLFWESAMVICNFINWSVWEGEGVIGVWLLLGAPSMHRMSSHILARQ